MVRNTAYARAVEQLLQKVSYALFGDSPPAVPVSVSVSVIVAGGAAVHYYTGSRVSKDLDAEFLARIFKPEATVLYSDEQGNVSTVHQDRNYTNALGMMHENYLDRVQASGWAAPGFRVQLLAPVDLAISKLARWQQHDQADVRSLVDAQLIAKQELEGLAKEALSCYIGQKSSMTQNIEEALSMFCVDDEG